jgi:hypothetical protein
MSSIYHQKTTQPTRDLPPPGPQPAALIALVDLGSTLSKFTNKDGSQKMQRLIYCVFELLGILGRPLLGKTFSLSFAPGSNLMEMLGGWRGKPIGPGEDLNLAAYLGKPALVVIQHDVSKSTNKPFACISAVTPPLAGMAVPEPAFPLVQFEIGAGPIPLEADALPWALGKAVRLHIEAAPEYQAWLRSTGAAPAVNPAPAADADQPF